MFTQAKLLQLLHDDLVRVAAEVGLCVLNRRAPRPTPYGGIEKGDTIRVKTEYSEMLGELDLGCALGPLWRLLSWFGAIAIVLPQRLRA